MTRRGVATAVVFATAGVVLAGCVNLPTSGSLGEVSPLPNSERSQIQVLPRLPGPGWGPTDIVGGFLAASGADLPLASKYLAPRYARKWHPSPIPRVIDTGFTVSPPITSGNAVPQRLTGAQPPGPPAVVVTVASDHLENFVPAGTSEAGRLQVSPASAPYQFNFTLIQVRGRWRISGITGLNGKPSTSIWLITDADFQSNYQARNLYYLSTVSAESLIPYPVYIPVRLGQLGSVLQLVKAVRSVPPTGSNWLYNAVTTAFPPRTTISAQVHANQAVVTLGGAATTADPAALKQIEAQLAWTLTYAPDSAGTGITFIHLQIGSWSKDLYPANFTSWIPGGPGWPLFYQTVATDGSPLFESYQPGARSQATSVGKSGTTKNHSPLAPGTSPVVLPSGLGRGPFAAVAVSSAPAGDSADTFAGCRGRTIYEASLLPNADLLQRSLLAKCTSLSWANPNDLWVIAGPDVFVVNQRPSPIQLQVTPVVIPDQQVLGSGSIVSLKVAPDGVRVAIIVRTRNSASVYVSAITKQKHSPVIYLAQGGPVLTVGPDVVNPISLSWWDSDHLLVLGGHHGASQLYLVPLTGGNASEVPTPPNAVSVSANGSLAAVGVLGSAEQPQQTVQIAHVIDGVWGVWTPVAAGLTPAYTGL